MSDGRFGGALVALVMAMNLPSAAFAFGFNSGSVSRVNDLLRASPIAERPVRIVPPQPPAKVSTVPPKASLQPGETLVDIPSVPKSTNSDALAKGEPRQTASAPLIKPSAPAVTSTGSIEINIKPLGTGGGPVSGTLRYQPESSRTLWTFSADDVLREVLTKWTEDSFWSLVWDKDVGAVRMGADASYRASFPEAARSLAMMMNAQGDVEVRVNESLRQIWVAKKRVIEKPIKIKRRPLQLPQKPITTEVVVPIKTIKHAPIEIEFTDVKSK